MIDQKPQPPTIDETLLVVVDVQKGFVSEHSERALPYIREVFNRWLAAGGKAVATQFVNLQNSPYVSLIGWSELMADDPQVDFHPAIADLVERASAVVRKHKYSSLTDEAVRIMQESQLRNVCIVGLDTESCVLATALAAFESNYVPWIITDAVASHSGEKENAAGLLVAGRYIGSGQLLSSREFFGSLDDSSGAGAVPSGDQQENPSVRL